MTWITKNIDVLKEEHHRQYGKEWAIGLDHYYFLKSLGLSNEDVFLDLGCGALRTGIHIIPEVNYYIGLDGHRESIIASEYEIKLNRLEKYKYDLIYTDKFNLKYTFDYIFAFSVFIHLSDEDSLKCIEMIKRCSHKTTKIIVNGLTPILEENFKVLKEHSQDSILTEHKHLYYEIQYN